MRYLFVIVCTAAAFACGSSGTPAPTLKAPATAPVAKSSLFDVEPAAAK